MPVQSLTLFGCPVAFCPFCASLVAEEDNKASGDAKNGSQGAKLKLNAAEVVQRAQQEIQVRT